MNLNYFWTALCGILAIYFLIQATEGYRARSSKPKARVIYDPKYDFWRVERKVLFFWWYIASFTDFTKAVKVAENIRSSKAYYF